MFAQTASSKSHIYVGSFVKAKKENKFWKLQTNFGGECILYADVIEQKIEFGDVSKCDFVMYLSVALSVLYAALLAALYTTFTYKKFKDKELK